jgi:hypothetical protein
MPFVSHLKTEQERVDAALTLFDRCVRGRTQVESRWYRNEKLYAGYIDKTTWPYGPMLSTRKVWEFVETEHALLYQGTAGMNPAFVVEPVDKADVFPAHKIRQYMTWQWETGMNFYPEFDRAILTGLVYGFSPMAIDWRTIYGVVPSRIPYTMNREKPGMSNGFIMQRDRRIVYQGPVMRALDPYSVYIEPTSPRFEDSPYYFRRVLVRWDELQAMGKRKLLKNVDKVGKKGSADKIVETDFRTRINQTLNRHNCLEWAYFDDNCDREVIECYFPGEDFYMLICAGGVALDEGAMPVLNSEISLVNWSNFACLWDWRGWSTPELTEDQAHYNNFIVNARLQAMNMSLMPMYLKDRGANIYDVDLTYTPYGLIETDSPQPHGGLNPLQNPNTWTQQSLAEEQKIDSNMEAILGLTDQRRGVSTVDRETKYSAAVRNEASGVRLGGKMQSLFRVMKEILGKQNRLNRQFFGSDLIVKRVVGADIPGFLKDQTGQRISAEEILADYDFIPMPTGSFGNRNIRKEEIIQFAGLFSSIPGLAQVFKFPLLAKMIAREWDFRNAEDLVDDTPEAQERALQQGPGGSPPGKGGGAGGAAAPQTAETALANIMAAQGAQ